MSYFENLKRQGKATRKGVKPTRRSHQVQPGRNRPARWFDPETKTWATKEARRPTEADIQLLRDA